MALQTMETWMKLEPTSGRPYYLRGLLNFELKENDRAIADLKKAIMLNPNDTRSMYNLATYYFQEEKDLQLAEKYIKKGLIIETDNQDFKYLLALIYRDQGKFKSSQLIMEELKANQQNSNN